MNRPEGTSRWTIAALAVLTLVLSVANPALVVAVPLGLMLVALPPRRFSRVLFGAALIALALTGFGAIRDGLWYLERGWVLLLGAWFIVMTGLVPAGSFLSRALSAVAATAVSTGAVLVGTRGWSELDWRIAQRFHGAAVDAARLWGGGEGAGPARGVGDLLIRAAEVQSLVFPALVGLGSLTGLALAWLAFRHLAEAGRNPLGRLRDFRFSDHLVWLLIGGVVLLILPFGEALGRTGSNLVLFMGALYALRGLAVVLVLAGSPGPLAMVLGGLLVLLLYPLVLAATVVVGLSDTWLDLRARRKARN